MAQDKRDQLYNNLINSGKVGENELGSREQFKQAISGEKQARELYHNLLNSGMLSEEEIGSENDFYGSISSDFAQPQQARPQQVQQPQQPKPKAQARVQPKAQAQAQTGGQNAWLPQGGFAMPDMSKPLWQQQAEARERLQEWRTEEGKAKAEKRPSKSQYKTAGEAYAGESQADRKLKEAEKKQEEERRVAVGQQMRDELDYWNASGERLKQDTGTNGTWTPMGLAATVARDEDGNIMYGEDGNSPLVSYENDQTKVGVQQAFENRDKVELDKIGDAYEELRQINALIDGDKPEWVDPITGTYHYNERSNEELQLLKDTRKQIEQRIKAIERRQRGVDSFWDGMVDAATDVDTWTLGLNNIGSNVRLLQVSEKMKRGEKLTNAEQMLVDAVGLNNEAQAELNEGTSRWYRSGRMLTEMLPFMGQIAATGGFSGVAAIGTKEGQRLAGKIAGDELRKRVARKFVENTGVVFGDVAAGFASATTTGLGNTINDVLQRRMGTLSADEQGEYQWTEGKDWWRAIGQGVASQTKEFATERFGEHIPTMRRMNVWLAKQGVGARKMARAMSGFAGSKAMRNTSKMLRKGGMQGVIPEIIEEEIGLPIDVAIGDMTWEEALSGKQQGDIVGGMFLTVGAMHAVTVTPQLIAQGAIKGYKGTVKGYNTMQYHRYKRRADKMSGKASALVGDEWDAIKDRIDNTPNDEIGGLYDEIIQNNNFTKEQKRGIYDYMNALMTMRGYNLGLMSKTEEEQAEEPTPEDAVESTLLISEDEGYNTTSEDDMRALRVGVEQAEDRLLEIGEEQIVGNLDEDPVGTLRWIADNFGTEEEDGLLARATAYVNAQAAYNGMLDRVRDDIDNATTAASQQIDARVNKADGMIHPVTLTNGGRQADIVDGNVVTKADGSIDEEKSTKDILLRDKETGEVFFRNINDIESMDEALNPEQLRSEATANITDEMTKEAVHKIEDVPEVDVDANENVNENQSQEVDANADNNQNEQTPVENVNANDNANEIANEQQNAEEGNGIPKDEKGKVQYHNAPMEQTLADLYDGTMDEEEISDFVDSNIAEAQKAYDEVKDKKATMSTDKQAYLAERDAIRAEQDEAKRVLDYWNEVKNRISQNANQEANPVEDVNENRKEVYNRHATAKQPAETAEASLSGEQSGTTPSTSMNAPTTSESKDTDVSSNMQENQEEVSEAHENILSQEEDSRREPLRQRAREWQAKTGVKVNLIERVEDIENPAERAAVEEQIARGKKVYGWFNPKTEEVYFFMPDCTSESTIDETFLHEVVAHKGLRKLLGKERFDALCRDVWDNVMDDAARERWSNYANVKSIRNENARQLAAADEYMAHMAENLDVENQSIWSKIASAIREALRSMGFDINLNDEDIRNLIRESYENLKSEQESKLEAEAEYLLETGTETDIEKGDAVKFAVADVLKGDERKKAIKELMDVTGRSEKTVKKWLQAEESLAKVILDNDNVGFLDMQVDESVPSIWKNADYPQGTVEFSNICRKRLPFTVIYQRLQEEFPNRVFDASTLEDIRNIMKENGADVACGLCYVEDRRQLLGEIGDGFIKMVKGEDTDINDNQSKALEKLRESGDEYVPNLYELLTLDGMKKLRREHPAVAQAFIEYNNARGMQAGRLFQAYSAYHREILDYTPARVKSINDNGGLRIFSFSDFEAHHLIDLVQVLTDCAAKGIKVQGYTKVPEFAKAVKETKMKLNRSLIAKGDGYVDENYAPQKGEAVSPNVVDGKRLLLDTVEGIDVTHPDFFDSTDNKNVGNILVGINDEHIRIAMRDSFVDYIIPFHSGLSEAIRQKKGIGGWTNYKLTQLEKKRNEKGKLVNADKHGINIYTDVLPRGEELIGHPIRNARDFQNAFFKACEEKGWIPRFEQFIDKDKNGKYKYTKGYEKLLLDFKMFDKNGKLLPQEVVMPIFDNEFNKKILDDYVKGEKSKVPYDELYEKIKEGLGLNAEAEQVSFRLAEEERPIQGLEGYTEQEVLDVVRGEIESRLADAGVKGVTIKDIALHGSRLRGDAREDSDLDVVMEYDGDISEDGLFNIINEEPIEIDGVKVDVNPITEGKSGTMAEYMQRSREYDERKRAEEAVNEESAVRFSVAQKRDAEKYDQENGTELSRFIDYLERGKKLNKDEKPFFHVGNTGELLQRYGMNGKITIGITAFSKRHSKDKHDLPIGKWIDVIRNINKPLAVTKYTGGHGDKSYRIYTPVYMNGDIVCAGVDVHTMGKNIEVTNISTAFRRELSRINKSNVEILLYPESQDALKKTVKQFSAAHNPLLYPQQSDAKLSNNSETAKENSEKVSDEGTKFRISPEEDAEYMKAVEDGDMNKAHQMVIAAAKKAMPDTKVVDENGNPRVVYHQTNSTRYVNKETGEDWDTLDWRAKEEWENRDDWDEHWEEQDFNEFDRRNARSTVELDGFFFAPEYDENHGYGKRTIAAFLNIKNPASHDDYDIDSSQMEAGRAERERMQREGYDGVIVTEDGKVIEYIAFEPNQIKSADPATYDDNGNVIPLSERFNEENPDIRFSISEEPFYSNAEHAVEGIKQEKATPEQWLKMIEKAGGLKAGEDKWLGLSDWLKGQDKKSLTKQEVMDFIRENQIQVEDVNYSEYQDIDNNPVMIELRNEFNDIVKEKDEDRKAASKEMEDFDLEMFEKYGYGFDGKLSAEDRSRMEAIQSRIDKDETSQEEALDEMVSRHGDDFGLAFGLDIQGSLEPNRDWDGELDDAVLYYLGMNDRPTHRVRLGYTTEGLENKKEIALVVPTIESWNEGDEIHFGDAGEGRAVAWIRFGDTTTNPNSEIASTAIMDDLEAKYGNPDDYSKMSDEDVARRTFANYLYQGGDAITKYLKDGLVISVGAERASKIIPLLDKMIADNADGQRVLVIDEIQSKRHQEGREKGYKWTYDPSFVIPERERYSAEKEGSTWWIKKDGETVAKLKAKSEDEAIAKHVQTGAVFDNEVDERIPDAPFEKNWHELAMKRMLRYAAENGYDKIAWTKGAQQAERYSLAKTVKSINRADTAKSKKAGIRIFNVDINGEQQKFMVNNDGIITGSTLFYSEADGKPLSDYFGKEWAVKMMTMEDGETLDTQNAKVGGEGMKGFYDQMLPRFMDKYGKKWGVKTQEVELPNVEKAGRTMWSVDITPEMKESVMQGQPMFKIGEDEKQPKRSKKEQRARESYAQRQWRRAHALAEEWAGKLNLGDRISFYDSIDDVPDSKNFSRQQKRNKGWYDPETDKIVVVYNNHRSPQDVLQTILREGVARYGLRELFGENYDTFLDNVWDASDIDIKEAIAARQASLRAQDTDKRPWYHYRRIATEDYLARLAEDTDFERADRSTSPQHWFNRVKTAFLQMLRDLGVADYIYAGDTLTDNELRYILWRSYKNLSEPDRYRNPFRRAENIAMQIKLDVGNYAQPSETMQQAAEKEVQKPEMDLSEVAEIRTEAENDGFAKGIGVYLKMKDGNEYHLWVDTEDENEDDYGTVEFYGNMDDEIPDEEMTKRFGKFFGENINKIFGSNIGELILRSGRIGISLPESRLRKLSGLEAPEDAVRFREQANEQQKRPDAEYEIDYDPIRFSLSKNNRSTISTWFNKRNDLTDEQKNAVLDYLDEMNNSKMQLATGRWFAKGRVRIPEDMPKVEQAIAVAEKAKVDPLQYDSPMDLIERHADIKIKEKPIDPDTVSTLHKAKEMSHGIVIYDVDDSEESRQNMRQIINTHFGKEASPWCLLQGDGNGNLTPQSIGYWMHYNTYPKQVAFKDGKLVAFSANDNKERVWWDRQDASHKGIPLGTQNVGDGKKQNAELLPNGRVKYYGHLFRGNKQNGVYEIFYENGQLIARSTYKDGLREGLYESWHKDGSRMERSEFKNGRLNGLYEHYNDYGQLRVRGNYKDDRRNGLYEIWHDNGQMKERSNYKDGKLDGLYEEWFSDGQMNLRLNYKDGKRDGLCEMWYSDGQMFRRCIFKNDVPVEDLPLTDDKGTPAPTAPEDAVRFMIGDPSMRGRVIARNAYERMVSTGAYQFQEAVQDSMLGLKRLYQAILGKNTHIEDVKGYQNAYLAENRMSSVNAAEQHEYFVRYMKPLLDAIGEIAGADENKRTALTDYLMAKHGLERNEVMAQRDYDEYVNEHPDGEKTLADFRKRDYAGLTDLTGTTNTADAEVEAQRMVDDYELVHDTRELWRCINNATKATLAKIYASGMLSKERYEQIQQMYEYYIPLRGWDETTSDEVYGYLTSNSGLFGGGSIKKAKGRSSKADDPIATIAMMADDAIRQGNRNKMKQTFHNFVLQHPSDLVSVNDLWLQYDDATDEWTPVFADIEDGDTAAVVEGKVQAFEERMEQLAENEPKKYKRGRDAVNIPYKVVKRNINEHQVLVQRDGRSYVLTINGNPRAAQALNGLTNPNVDIEGVVGNMLKGAEWINRNLSAVYTTRNPDFVVSNYLRDTLYSNCMTWVKEDPDYALRFNYNFGRFNPARLLVLMQKWENGTLDDSDYIEHMFRLFMLNGGETGYTNVKDIEGHKREIAKELKTDASNVRHAWSWLGTEFDVLNRCVENNARFAAFLTSMEMGRSLERSIYDAKEVSVNFNKKGSGGKMVNATGQTLLGKAGAYLSGGGRLLYVFWNAGVQGTTNFAKAAKRHPVKALSAAASMYALGAAIPLLAQAMAGAAGGGDDDDKNAYYNLPEYVRRSNIIFKAGDQWVTIPLPIEFRAWYGLGELATGVITGKERYSDSELAFNISSQVSQIFPLDVLEGGGGFTPFIPSSAKPLVEAYILNKSWSGLPIYRDSPWNKTDPEWTKAYQSANAYLVSGAKWLNEISGGDDYKKGWVDINPAKVEYLLSGMFGGLFTTGDKLVKMGETAFGEREFDWRNMLLANRVIKTGDERTESRKLSNEYFKYKERYDEVNKLLKRYAEAAPADERYRERLERLQQSKDYLLYDVFGSYEPLLQGLNEAKKGALDMAAKRIGEEETTLRREMVNLMHAIEDDKNPDYESKVDSMLNREYDEGRYTRRKAGNQIAKRMGGTDTYGNPSTEYGKVYERKRDHFDLAEDVLLQVAQKKAKEDGNEELSKALDSARRDITKAKKPLGEVSNEEDVDMIMENVRALRNRVLHHFGILPRRPTEKEEGQ